ncbi:hypothetical protein [Bosea sp. NPDC055594]
MTHVSGMQPTNDQASHRTPDAKASPAGEPAKFPVLFAVIAGAGLLILATMLVEFVAR